MAQANDKYILLEQKIIVAHEATRNFSIKSQQKDSNYQIERQHIITKYFSFDWNGGAIDKEIKEHLLDMFEKCNENIKLINGY